MIDQNNILTNLTDCSIEIVDKENLDLLMRFNRKELKDVSENYLKVLIGLSLYINKNIENNTIKLSQDGFYEIELSNFIKEIFNIHSSEDILDHYSSVKEILFKISNLKI